LKDKSVVFIETCYRLYEQKMYAVAFRILNDRHLAEDVVQETFLKLMRRDVYFEDAESAECKGYLIKALKHSAIDIYRKREKEQERIFLVDDESEYEGETTCNPTGTVESELTAYARQLPEKYRDVVACLVENEMSVRETADKLGITETNVRQRFRRAKNLLREKLDHERVPTKKGVESIEQNRKIGFQYNDGRV